MPQQQQVKAVKRLDGSELAPARRCARGPSSLQDPALDSRLCCYGVAHPGRRATLLQVLLATLHLPSACG